MNYITFSELRTRPTELLNSLLMGQEVGLIHKSKIVGTIYPNKYEGKVFTKKDGQDLINLANKLNLPMLTDSQREARYRAHLVKKYGKDIS